MAEAEQASEALRCLAEMSDGTAQNLKQEIADSQKEKQGTSTTLNDHDYVEGAEAKRSQRKTKIDIVNLPVVPVGVAFVPPARAATSDQDLSQMATAAVEETSPKFDQSWTNKGTWSSPYKGYLSNNEDLDEAIKLYTKDTDSRWVVSAKDRLFGANDIKLGNFKLFWRGREDNRKAVFPDFDGFPFIMVGRKTWGCHLGRDKCRSGKIKYRTKLQEESREGAEDKWPLIRSSKKLGCPAVISGVHVLKFHEYPIALSMSEFHRKQTLKRLRQSLLSKHSIVKAEQRFYVHLAEPEEHIHDTNDLQDSSSPSVKVDRRLIYKITELYHAGMFRLADVGRVLDDYVKQLYKDDTPPPKELIPELYPSSNCIHYFISHAVKVTSLLEMDLGHGHRLVSSWQTSFPNDSWYYQPFASSGPIKRAKNKQDQRLVGHYPDLSQNFLFCCQNAAQRRLLGTYGSVCVLDSPQGKTVLPTYFLQVRTNIGYQVVCTIIMQYWSSSALVEAMQVVRDWNPEWQPQAFLMDLIEDEIQALEKLFPDCQILISVVHRERAWLDCLNATDDEDESEDSADLLDSLVYATTEEELQGAVQRLQDSTLWKESERLRHWMTVRWLPCIKRWSFAYFSKQVLVTLGANEGPQMLREALEYDWLEGIRSRTLSELLTYVVMDRLPKLYDSYCEENHTLAASTRYQNCSLLPAYIRHQPVSVRSYINEVLSSLPPTTVTKTSEGKFLVRLEDDEYEHTVSFGSETEYPACDCLTWVTKMEICQHFCAVFKTYDDWHWCQLSTLYTENPIFALDQTQLDTPIQATPRCGDLSEPSISKEYIQVTMDDFGAEEVLEDDNEDVNIGTDSSIASPAWQIDQKQTTCKSLLDQLGQLTEQMKDPEAMDYMTNNLVVLLKQMQGKKNAPPSPDPQEGRKKLRSGTTR